MCGWCIWMQEEEYGPVQFLEDTAQLSALMKRFAGVKEGLAWVKLSLSEGHNLMFTQANVSCWLAQADPLSPSPGLQLPPKALNAPESAGAWGSTASLGGWWQISGDLTVLCQQDSPSILNSEDIQDEWSVNTGCRLFWLYFLMTVKQSVVNVCSKEVQCFSGEMRQFLSPCKYSFGFWHFLLFLHGQTRLFCKWEWVGPVLPSVAAAVSPHLKMIQMGDIFLQVL